MACKMFLFFNPIPKSFRDFDQVYFVICRFFTIFYHLIFYRKLESVRAKRAVRASRVSKSYGSVNSDFFTIEAQRSTDCSSHWKEEDKATKLSPSNSIFTFFFVHLWLINIPSSLAIRANAVSVDFFTNKSILWLPNLSLRSIRSDILSSKLIF